MIAALAKRHRAATTRPQEGRVVLERLVRAKGVPGEAFNVACGARISLNEILGELRELTGKKIEADYANPRPGDVRHSLADVSKARESLGYEPIVDIREGLRLAFNWYEERRRGATSKVSAA